MITSAKDAKKTEEKKIRMKTSRTHKPDDLSLEEWQRLLRKQFGEQMAYRLENVGDHPLFSDYALTNPESGRKYKIAIRGDKPGDNYCSCPDFSINNLGTCKHIEYTLSHLMQKSQERQEAEQDETAARLKELAEIKGAAFAATDAGAAGKGLEQLGSLLASGAQFLTNLSKIISQPSTSAEGSMGGLVARDEKTGKSYLKIPLPDKDVMQQAFSALGDFFAKAMQMGDTKTS